LSLTIYMRKVKDFAHLAGVFFGYLGHVLQLPENLHRRLQYWNSVEIVVHQFGVHQSSSNIKDDSKDQDSVVGLYLVLVRHMLPQLHYDSEELKLNYNADHHNGESRFKLMFICVNLEFSPF
jgi:hypothetical protein